MTGPRCKERGRPAVWGGRVALWRVAVLMCVTSHRALPECRARACPRQQRLWRPLSSMLMSHILITLIKFTRTRHTSILHARCSTLRARCAQARPCETSVTQSRHWLWDWVNVKCCIRTRFCIKCPTSDRGSSLVPPSLPLPRCLPHMHDGIP